MKLSNGRSKARAWWLQSVKTARRRELRRRELRLHRLRRRELRCGLNNDDMATNGEKCLARWIVPQCRTVFDVGANAGKWSALALEINPQLRLTAFEPDPATFAGLSARAWPASIRLVNGALGESQGVAKLFRSKGCAAMNSLHFRSGVTGFDGDFVSVEVQSLDGFCKQEEVERIDFLKIDAEGHDVFVLRGARRMFQARRIRFAQIEYGGTYRDADASLRQIFAFARAIGYRVFRLHPRGLKFLPCYMPHMENFQLQNFLLVAPGETVPAQF